MQRSSVLASRFPVCARILGRGCRHIANRTFATATVRTTSTQESRPSPSAREIKNNVPKFWIQKMRTFFKAIDHDGDGVFTVKDYYIWEQGVSDLFPASFIDVEQAKNFKSTERSLWLTFVFGKEPEDLEGMVLSEDMFIENMFEAVNRPNAEGMIRNGVREIFAMVDINKDGEISREEFKRYLMTFASGTETWAIVGFSAMDTNQDGRISMEEFADGCVDFNMNFADETKPAKYWLGKLVD